MSTPRRTSDENLLHDWKLDCNSTKLYALQMAVNHCASAVRAAQVAADEAASIAAAADSDRKALALEFQRNDRALLSLIAECGVTRGLATEASLAEREARQKLQDFRAQIAE